jgi:hypothetical protein
MRNPGRGWTGVSSSVDVGGTGLAPSRVGEVTMQSAFWKLSQKDAILIIQFNYTIVVKEVWNDSRNTRVDTRTALYPPNFCADSC